MSVAISKKNLLDFLVIFVGALRRIFVKINPLN